ncbi:MULTISPECIES: hypothetical protein [Chryseobacterium]|nr:MULTISPECIES: hypothetical protein [Chryseobacterium]
MENIFVRKGISFSQDYYYFDSLLSETPCGLKNEDFRKNLAGIAL